MFAADFDERLGLITCERIVQPVGQSIALLAEWQWMDTSKDITTQEEKRGDNCGSSKVR